MPNYAYLSNGRKIVYEVCSTPWGLINDQEADEPFALKLDRYKVVLSLGLTIRGLPAIYINGLLGAKNYFPQEDFNKPISPGGGNGVIGAAS